MRIIQALLLLVPTVLLLDHLPRAGSSSDDGRQNENRNRRRQEQQQQVTERPRILSPLSSSESEDESLEDLSEDVHEPKTLVVYDTEEHAMNYSRAHSHDLDEIRSLIARGMIPVRSRAEAYAREQVSLELPHQIQRLRISPDADIPTGEVATARMQSGRDSRLVRSRRRGRGCCFRN